MHGVAEAGEEVEAVGAGGGVRVVDEDLFEEGIDGGAERRELGDGAAIVVGGDAWETAETTSTTASASAFSSGVTSSADSILPP